MTFPIDNPKAQYYQAKVAYENAKSSFDRMASYFETGGLSKQQYDNAKAQFETAEANWDATRQSVMVKAPISGIVTKLNVRESDNVLKEEELFTVAQTNKLKTHLWVAEKDISFFKVGQSASAVWNDITLNGKIIQVDMSINTQRQAFGVVVEFDNPERLSLLGITARVKVNVIEKNQILVLQRKNIMNDNMGSYVFLAKDSSAVKKYINLGQASDIQVEIIDGIQAGDVLITEGQLHLDDGTKIRLVTNTTKGTEN